MTLSRSSRMPLNVLLTVYPSVTANIYKIEKEKKMVDHVLPGTHVFEVPVGFHYV